MGDSPRALGFGEIELDLDWDDGAASPSAPAPEPRDESRVHTRVTRRALELPVLDGDDPDIPADELETLARDFTSLRPTAPPPSTETLPPPSGDGPDSAVDVEYGEAEEIDVSDPAFDEDDACSEPPPPATVPPTAGPLTLTQRHSVLRLKAEDIASLPIDHRGGFLLSHVDGMHSLEEILDICAMPQVEALEIIANLEALGVIEFE